MEPLSWLGFLMGSFLATHLLLSHGAVRSALTARLGEPGFRAAYSAVALALYVPFVWIWWTHRHTGPAFWVLRDPVSTHVGELVAATGFGLIFAGVMQPAPSSFAMATAGKVLEPRGITHVTRHPLNMGVALVMLAHLPGNGWASDLWFFGGNLVLAVLGVAHQDLRLVAARPEYAAFVARTTLLPNPLGFARIGAKGWAAVGVGVGAAVGFRLLHPGV